MKPQFYMLGFANLRRGAGCPHEIAICFDPIAQPVGIAEGIGQGSGGRLMTASEAIGGDWDANFRACNAEWLIPYLRQLAAGEPLPRADLLARFRQLHGREPELSNFGDCLPAEVRSVSRE